MKAEIERILETENTAKQLIAKAEQDARELVAQATANRTKRLEAARETARAEANAMLEKAATAAEAERAQITQESQKRAEYLKTTAQRLDTGFLDELLRSVCGTA